MISIQEILLSRKFHFMNLFIVLSLLKGIRIEMSRQLMHIEVQFNLISKFELKSNIDTEYIIFIFDRVKLRIDYI